MTAAPPAVIERLAQPRHLIVTLYGLRGLDGRQAGRWFSVAALVRLLADLGIDEAAVRSSVSRLKRRGMLIAEKVGGAAGYALSEPAEHLLDEGDQRIFALPRPSVRDGWILAVFSVPESERDRRHTLRTQLSRLGFGTVSPGVWIAPAHLRTSATDLVARLELTPYVEFFSADYLNDADLTSKIGQWWDMERLHDSYADFLAGSQPVWRRWARRRTATDQEAFADYVPILTQWRRLPYLDPGLPAQVLPADWNGAKAAELFGTIRERLEKPARRHLETTVSLQGEPWSARPTRS
ncbi:PaaX family transcriptional regulator [Fodinicola feengrottensis]|uniref:PaaX family transcriptional regulator n=1 Tax=Fodinicola feengrottensis TaxID=435914 RepID=UPI0031DDB623